MNKKFYYSFTAILCYILIDAFFMPWVYPGVMIPWMDPAIGVSGFRLPLMQVREAGVSDYIAYIVYLYPICALLILFLGSLSTSIINIIVSSLKIIQLLPTLYFAYKITSMGTMDTMLQSINSFGIGMYHTLIVSALLFIVGVKEIFKLKN